LKVQGAFYIGAKKVIAAIFVPGTMNLNLREHRHVPLQYETENVTG